MGADNPPAGGPTEPTPTIGRVDPVVTLLQKPAMANLYLRLLDSTATVPAVLDETSLTKSTVYEYIDALETAGLVTETGERDGATTYRATEFSLTLEVGTETVTITPDVVAVLAHQEQIPTIQTVLEQYGIATLVTFIDYAHDHAAGHITTRMIADQLNLSRGIAFDLLEHVSRILDLGDEPETVHPEDISDSERETLLEDAREQTPTDERD